MKYAELAERFRTSEVLTTDPKSINTPYKKKKALLRCLAEEWQWDFQNETFDWWDITQCQEFFTKHGKKYGLLNEFRENGII